MTSCSGWQLVAHKMGLPCHQAPQLQQLYRKRLLQEEASGLPAASGATLQQPLTPPQLSPQRRQQHAQPPALQPPRQQQEEPTAQPRQQNPINKPPAQQQPQRKPQQQEQQQKQQKQQQQKPAPAAAQSDGTLLPSSGCSEEWQGLSADGSSLGKFSSLPLLRWPSMEVDVVNEALAMLEQPTPVSQGALQGLFEVGSLGISLSLFEGVVV